MNNINVFISVGAPCTDDQESFVSAIESRLRAENLSPNTVGRNKFGASSPLKTVIELMDECFGTIIIALERTFFLVTARRLQPTGWLFLQVCLQLEYSPLYIHR